MAKLLEKISSDIKDNLKQGNSQKVILLRGILSSLHNEQIKIGRDTELTDERSLEIVSSEAKKRKDAIILYEKGDRPEKAKIEKEELEIISKYLPKQLSEEELIKVIKEVIIQTGATTIQEMGLVMGQVMQKTKGKSDGNIVKELVQKELG
jgi:uncharacterized protein